MQWLINILYEMVMANFAGTIVMWSGTIATIPSGWQLCDGTNDTPDLRDRFVVCASQDMAGVAKSNVEGIFQQTGGSDKHQHNLLDGTDMEKYYADYAKLTDLQYHIPPFYALAYIMKV